MYYLSDYAKVVLTFIGVGVVALVIIIWSISTVVYIHYDQEVEACLEFTKQDDSYKGFCHNKFFNPPVTKSFSIDQRFELEKIKLLKDCEKD